MSVHTNTSEEKFGTDLGLIHQVVVAGRDAGMDRTAWAALAHNKELLTRVAHLAHHSLTLSPEDHAAVSQWITKTAGTDLPFREEESYYPRSSHSSYRRFFGECHDAMTELFWKAQHNEEARELCKEIEILFILAYCYSALRMAVYEPEENKNEGMPWFHSPLYGFHITFEDVFKGDGRTSPGWFNRAEYFKTNDAVLAVQTACEKFDTTHNEKYEWPSAEAKAAAVRDLYDVVRGARDNQKQKILQLIGDVAEQFIELIRTARNEA